MAPCLGLPAVLPQGRLVPGIAGAALSSGGVPPARLNASGGNGFDDDCDGQVDEGCACSGNGSTRACYLVPATQVDPASGLPVGWCAANAKGSLDCSATACSIVPPGLGW